jgi:hypothetical protein
VTSTQQSCGDLLKVVVCSGNRNDSAMKTQQQAIMGLLPFATVELANAVINRQFPTATDRFEHLK